MAGPLLFYARRRDFFEETKLLGSLQLLDSQVLRPNDGCDTAVRRIVTPAFALDDMWTVAKRIIVDVYGKIAGISTVLAGLMSAELNTINKWENLIIDLLSENVR